jgi:glutamate racemase
MFGMFDSGSGGLSVLRELRKRYPNVDVLYYADTAHMPYGDKTRPQIRRYVRDAIRFLRANNVECVIDACNTASSVLMKNRDVVGMIRVVGRTLEPSIQKTLIVATNATISSCAYQHIFDRKGIPYLTMICGDFAEAIECIDNVRVDLWIRAIVDRARQEQCNSIFLACTHYSIVQERFLSFLRDQASLIRVIDASSLFAGGLSINGEGDGRLTVETSGRPLLIDIDEFLS